MGDRWDHALAAQRRAAGVFGALVARGQMARGEAHAALCAAAARAAPEMDGGGRALRCLWWLDDAAEAAAGRDDRFRASLRRLAWSRGDAGAGEAELRGALADAAEAAPTLLQPPVCWLAEALGVGLRARAGRGRR